MFKYIYKHILKNIAQHLQHTLLFSDFTNQFNLLKSVLATFAINSLNLKPSNPKATTTRDQRQCRDDVQHVVDLIVLSFKVTAN